jgi:drug/metabolite transporter (DMT)-like permease
MSPGVVLALGSAALFGLSTPVAKALLGASDPWILAGLLYGGAGVGLALVLAFGGTRERAEAKLARDDLPWLAGAVLAGGVAAPVLLMLGLVRMEAGTASLLLTLEGVLTAVLAWFVFRENFDRRIAVGMLAIVAGAATLAWPAAVTLGEPLGPLLVTLACLGWAIDNNLTRKVALADPVRIAAIKGLVAGPVSLSIGLTLGAEFPAPAIALAAAVTGFFGYGVSLVFFVLALRHLGTARTGAYFSTAPFLGTLASVVVLGEAFTPVLFAAGALMALGVWLHLSERHAHEHTHDELEHTHRHAHDEHHDHDHPPGVDPAKPHSHAHRHVPLRHSHPHVPDSHHRHTH